MPVEVQHGWARTGELYIAYEVHGDADVDIVIVPGLLNTLMAPVVSHELAAADDAMCRFARLIKLDKRGTGLSDRFPSGTAPTVEERIDDVRAVMDAVGCERACVMGEADGGPVAIVFAATYPERVSSLVLNTTGPRGRWAPDWPWGIHQEQRAELNGLIHAGWGTGVMADLLKATSTERRREFAALERLAGTPTAVVAALDALGDTDVRDALSSVAAPTLVLHDADHPLWPVQAARYLAEHISGARIVEQASRAPEDAFGRNRTRWMPILEEFVTGARANPVTDRVFEDRALHRHRRIDGAGCTARGSRLDGVARPARRVDPPGARAVPRRRDQHDR